MPWQNAVIIKNTELDTTFGVSVEFTDVSEFATNVFIYSQVRVINDAAGRQAFKDNANAAVAVERSRRQNLTGKEIAILVFMNL